MNWLRPRSVAARTQWAEEHPWIAGCYFGFFLAAFLSVLGIGRSVWLIVVVGVVTWLVGGLIFTLSIKRRWGKRWERSDAKTYPAPTALRPWTRASDRFLLWFMVLGVAGALAWAVGLVMGSENAGVAVLGLGSAAWLSGTTWMERKRRQASGSVEP